MLGSLVVGKVIEQNGAEDGTLGFHVGWKAVRETVVGSGQCFVTGNENQLRKSNAIVAAKWLWTLGEAFGNSGTNRFFSAPYVRAIIGE